MDKSERNDEICRRYFEGESASAIARDLGLTRERVRQILRRRGVPPRDPADAEVPRYEHLGVVLSDAEKDALRAEAARRGVSMSSLTAELIREMLASVQQ